MVLSADPVAKNVLHGEIAIDLTHPWWPTITLYNLKGGCQFGLINFLKLEDLTVPNCVDYARFIYNFFDIATVFYWLF